MIRFILRRLAIIPIALLLVNFLGFTYAHYARPLRAARTPYVRAVEAGLLLPAYGAYLESLFNLDFGLQLNVPGSTRTGPISLGDTLWRATGASLGLMAVALAASLVLGFFLGFKAVNTEPPGVARWLTLVSTMGLAMPSFYIGSLFIMGLVFYILWRGPGSQIPLPLDGFGWDRHLVLPALALMARPTVQLAQVAAALLSGELGKQYVVASRSLGYTWRSIRNQYALRNVIAPVILTIAGLLRLLVGELVLVEWLFKWPGLGRLLAWTLVPAQLTSSSGSPLFLNPPVMAAVLTLIAALFLLSDFLAALLVRLFDPRLRQAESETYQL
jgi:ABC-type dipeptide/oligopeptide/nickel transport system permease component